MALPAPHLDDRTFQDLVDEAKRYVQATCREWTDHNVSDPGVTLIETFAMMVDQLIYRLNRVPERNYVKFLELIGVRMFPPAAARGSVTFWLSAPQQVPVVVREETEVATDRTDVEDAVVFTTSERLTIPPCSLARLATQDASGQTTDRTETLRDGIADPAVPIFSDVPVPGDALLLGLSTAVPSCALLLRFDGPVGGIGIDPRDPPLLWQAWTPNGWADCEVDWDDTDGFNTAGDVVLHVPATHEQSALAGGRAGWLRCVVTDKRPAYTRTPRISLARAVTIGGTAPIVHAEVVEDEVLGVADGTPSARYRLRRVPVVAAAGGAVLEVREPGAEPRAWEQVHDFASSGPADPHYRLDPVTGEVELGPAVRTATGEVRQYGAVPARGAELVARRYRTGGGRRGNVGRTRIRVLKSSIPFVSSVENRQATTGGADGETTEEAKVRGPLELRSSGRAVTADDFEELARAVAPEAARVRCVPSSRGDAAVRLLVVPFVPAEPSGRIAYEELAHPRADLLQTIGDHLDRRRLVGTRLLVVPPAYQGVTVVATVTAAAGHERGEVQAAAVQAVHRFLSPLDGGPDGTGWPFGRPVNDYDVSAVLARVPGLELVEGLKLFPADPTRNWRGQEQSRIPVAEHALVYSYQPQIRVR